MVPRRSSGLGVYAAALLVSAVVYAQSVAPAALLDQFAQAQYAWQQLEIGQQIVRAGDRSVLPRVELWLTHDDRQRRANGAYVLAGLGDPRGLKTLLAILSDRSFRRLDPDRMRGNMSRASPEVQSAEAILQDRYHVVHVLGVLRDPGAVDALVPLLSDDTINYKVAWALGEIGDQRAVPALVAALHAPKPLVRASVIYALETLRARDAIVPLQSLLGDLAVPSAGYRTTVAESAERAIAHLAQPGNVPRLLPPAAFNNLPVEVRQALEQRGCEIPQIWMPIAPHNVVRGHFTNADTTDIAVLCSRKGTSVVLVFRGESTAEVAEIASRADADDFQTVDARGTMGYSRQLAVASPAFIGQQNGELPGNTKLDHDGIEDAFVEKGSNVWYWSNGRWLQLLGTN